MTVEDLEKWLSAHEVELRMGSKSKVFYATLVKNGVILTSGKSTEGLSQAFWNAFEKFNDPRNPLSPPQA